VGIIEKETNAAVVIGTDFPRWMAGIVVLEVQLFIAGASTSTAPAA